LLSWRLDVAIGSLWKCRNCFIRCTQLLSGR
jgi:hypothetical protein